MRPEDPPNEKLIPLVKGFRANCAEDDKFNPIPGFSVHEKLILDPIAFDSPGYIPLRAKSSNCISLLKNANPWLPKKLPLQDLLFLILVKFIPAFIDPVLTNPSVFAPVTKGVNTPPKKLSVLPLLRLANVLKVPFSLFIIDLSS